MTVPYYTDEWVTIYLGRAEEILPELRDVDMVFTSPPYNLGTSTGNGRMHAGSLAARDLSGGYGLHDDAMSVEEYDQWQRLILTLSWESLTETGAIFYNHKPRVQAGVLVLPTAYGGDLPLRQIVTWDRGTGMNFSETFFLPKSEWIVIWAKEGFRLRDKSASQVGDVWSIRPEQLGDHPAPFPIELPQTAIGATTAQVILDPFAGSGTTLRAAKNLGRRSIGIELEERFCEMAANRCAQEVLFS